MDDNTKTEIPLKDLLSSILNDDELSDVKLQGTDGVQVGASRIILAGRSTVFRQMLLGKFKESTSPVVELGFEGYILKAVVEYIHLDSISTIIDQKKRKKITDCDSDINKIRELVTLAAAAAYFQLPGLSKKVQESMSGIIENKASLSFSFLQVCTDAGPTVPAEISTLALESVRTKARGHIDGAAVEGLSSAVLEIILKDEKVAMTELDLFNILRFWLEANQQERTAAAKGFLGHLSLEKIDAVSLSTIVTSSGLATVDQLAEAYKKRALLAEEKTRGSLELRRPREAVWKTSKSKEFSPQEGGGEVVDLLDIPPMISGIHQWKILLGCDDYEDCSPCIGIVSTECKAEQLRYVGEEALSWGFDCACGQTYLEGDDDKIDAKVEEGQTLTLTLNLQRDQPGNGTLTCRLETEEQEHTIVSNLLGVLGEHPGGFIPAVSGMYPSCLVLRDLRELHDS